MVDGYRYVVFLRVNMGGGEMSPNATCSSNLDGNGKVIFFCMDSSLG